eukprot:COSAG01_NODE_240_length_20656_cov_53.398259_15_plen_60_part_00
MAIPEAAEFLFCRFRRFREIVYFLSDRQSESPLSPVLVHISSPYFDRSAPAGRPRPWGY